MAGLVQNPLDSADLIVAGAALWSIGTDPSTEALDQYKANTESVLRLLSSLVRESGTSLVWLKQAYVNESVPRKMNLTNHLIRKYNEAVDKNWQRFRTPGMFLFSRGDVPMIPDGVHYTQDSNDGIIQVILNTHCNSQLPVTDRK
eukprot:scpid105494/ scgid1456/ 